MSWSAGPEYRFKIGRLGNETGNSHVMEALNVKLLNYLTAFKISDQYFWKNNLQNIYKTELEVG